MGISADGRTVVVANRMGQSASLLRLGEEVAVKHSVVIDGEATAVAVTPDGTRALVTKFAEHAVAVLDIEGDTLKYDPANDIAVGRRPYNVQITPNGKLALVASNGNNGFPDGHVDTVTVIDLEVFPPRAIDHVTVGDGPAGLAISPDGTLGRCRSSREARRPSKASCSTTRRAPSRC
jgi:DNA-binding beta-propeller fold protein YncE